MYNHLFEIIKLLSSNVSAFITLLFASLCICCLITNLFGIDSFVASTFGSVALIRNFMGSVGNMKK